MAVVQKTLRTTHTTMSNPNASSRSGGITRRLWLSAAAVATSLTATRTATANHAVTAWSPNGALGQAQFHDIAGTYLDAGSVHPFSIGGREAVKRFVDSRAMNGADPEYSFGAKRQSVLDRFATLINASPREVAYVQSTSAGEQMVVTALGLPERGGRIVTDVLHFFGSFHLYNELEKAGMEVVVLPMREGRISMDDMEAAVNDRTRLLAVSAISTINGFQHDLKAVADLAHAHGAKVYVDAVHAIGSVPFDVKATGIDFMATASYKWLMADMGLGFAYVREDLIPELKRPQAGYQQLAVFSSHAHPYDPPANKPFVTRARDDAAGLFAMGTFSNTGVAHLDWSLDYLSQLGVGNIQTYRQPIIDYARQQVPLLGFEPITPADSTGPLVAFAKKDARSLHAQKLRDAKVEATLATNRLRVSVSVFNTRADINRLLEALS